MNIPTKAKINIKESIIELEGEESFVTKYLDEFKGLISASENKPTKEPIMLAKQHAKEPNKKKRKINSNPKKVEIEPFETKGDAEKNIPSLKDYFEAKKPTEGSPSRIATIGNYITKILGQKEFSEGNIEFAYTALKLNKRLKHLHQAMLDAKNVNKYLKPGSNIDKWILSRIGELYVEDDLPPKQKGDKK